MIRKLRAFWNTAIRNKDAYLQGILWAEKHLEQGVIKFHPNQGDDSFNQGVRDYLSFIARQRFEANK